MERYLQKINGDMKPTRQTYRTIHRSGQTQWVEISSVLIDWEGKPATLNLLTNITERKQMEKALRESEERYRELSIVDDLTQLYNSRNFYFQLKIELERSNRYKQPLTLLLFDIDNFKAFNDTYGHIEGDHVLRRLGQVVKRCLRETDLAFRYGGEEFTIILPMTTSADGSVTAERIRTEFKKENFSPAPDQDVHLTVSIGLAQYKPKEDMKAFVHRVDHLMYQGKKVGKDNVCSEA
jgi:diguanylate cyclase (GGDEF)-like protein